MKIKHSRFLFFFFFFGRNGLVVKLSGLLFYVFLGNVDILINIFGIYGIEN